MRNRGLFLEVEILDSYAQSVNRIVACERLSIHQSTKGDDKNYNLYK